MGNTGMKSNDKLLFGIVGGMIMLIVAAFLVTLNRPEPTYREEDTPEGVAHNYLLALQKEDYGRAYGYLSPTLKGRPRSQKAFLQHIQRYSWNFRLETSTTLTVESSKIIGKEATVTVRETQFRGGGLFDSGQSTNTFDMKLRLNKDEWKIVGSTYYFANCWNEAKGCE
jgi:hypothetical protein